MEFFAWGGPYALAVTLVILWLWPGRRERLDDRQHAVLHAALAVGLALLVNQAILLVWQRPRPFVAHAATLLLAPSSDPSFPSDHAAFSFAIAAALVRAFRRGGVAALVFAGAIAFARVFTGEHYVADVLAGAFIGSAAAVATLPAEALVSRLLEPALRLARKIHLA